MSGIYIPNMKLPEGEGSETIIRIQPDGEVLDLHKIHLCKQAIAVPDHGRLIDGDILQGQMKKRKNFVGRVSDADCLVADAPTIIPADEEDGDG